MKFLTSLLIITIILSSPSFAGEDPVIIYSKSDGKIDTAIDTSSSGYMRNGTKLVVSCSASGCPSSPPIVLPPTGKPLAKIDAYKSSARYFYESKRKFTGLSPVRLIFGTWYKPGGLPMAKERAIVNEIAFSLPVMENDVSGPYAPIRITNLQLETVSLLKRDQVALKVVGDKIEVSFLKIAVGDTIGGNITFSYEISDARNQTSSVVSSFNFSAQESPLVLDLDGDGIELMPMMKNAIFDINMDGVLDRVSWVYSDDGLLALDRNGDGIISNRLELFGNHEEEGIDNGFENLLRYDDNKDYIIDKKDKIFSKLIVWRDLNMDGIGKAGELKSLAQTGIVSISLNAVNSNFMVGENTISNESYFIRSNGTRGQIVDAWFNQVLMKPMQK